MGKNAPSAKAQSRGHEIADVDARALIWGAVAVVITMIACAYIVDVLIGASAPDNEGIQNFGRPAAEALAKPPRPPSRGLPSTPIQGPEALARRKEALLHGYGWVDKKATIARIPIERAMKLIVNEGLPDFGEGSAVKRRR
jgi:hypothetical protein